MHAATSHNLATLILQLHRPITTLEDAHALGLMLEQLHDFMTCDRRRLLDPPMASERAHENACDVYRHAARLHRQRKPHLTQLWEAIMLSRQLLDMKAMSRDTLDLPQTDEAVRDAEASRPMGIREALSSVPKEVRTAAASFIHNVFIDTTTQE